MKLRSTADPDAPGVANYEDVWKNLKTAESLFGGERQWFVRPSYIKRFDDIIADKERKYTQIVNGTAGVGKSSFSLYALARCRCAGKSSLLHYHRTDNETVIAVFSPVMGMPVAIISAPPVTWKRPERGKNKSESKGPFSWWMALYSLQRTTVEVSHM